MSKTVSIEDNLAIQDLLGRYCWYFDDNHADEWAALYTEDGVFDAGPAPVQGTAALRELPQRTAASLNGALRHQVGNLYLEQEDADRITARYYNQVTNWSEGGKLAMLALCTVDLVRTADGWKIRRNKARMLM